MLARCSPETHRRTVTTTDQQALTDALAAEHAAVYAYGVVAAYAAADRERTIAEYSAAHRARRDATADALRAAGVPAPASAAAYNSPFPVTDANSANRLAATVESDTAVAWRSVVERADSPDTRRAALDALTDCALRLTTWQAALGANPPTAAFPGQP